jgi:hypothetical protein
MVARWLSVAVLLVVGGLIPLACSGEPYNEACGSAEGCGTSSQVTDPTLPDCSMGLCKCLDPEQVVCCPFGMHSCSADLIECRSKADCDAEGSSCESDADCPGPPDPRCGEGRCKEGACELDIRTAESIPNQYPGDCKVTRCSAEGALEVVADPNDMPDDGNPCTFDTCEGDEPKNLALPDANPCPGDTAKVCWAGTCRACSEPLNFEKCPAGLYCRYQWCVPYGCISGHKDGQETGMDCGGPDCQACGDTGKCLQASDCMSGVCKSGLCQAPQPDDGIKNGGETGVDCGHPGGPPCADGEGCTAASYCTSGVCYKGLCQKPSCLDSIKNGAETGPDCGGECSPCPD